MEVNTLVVYITYITLTFRGLRGIYHRMHGLRGSSYRFTFFVYLPLTSLYCAHKREVGPATSTITTTAQQQDDNTFIFVYIGNTARANLPRWLQQNVAIVIFKFL